MIEENSLYLKGKTAIESNQQYKEIQGKHKIESDKLNDIQSLNSKKQEQEKIFSELKKDIIIQSKNYYEKLNEILSSLNVETGKLKIKASVNTKFSEYKEILNRSIHQQVYQDQNIQQKGITYSCGLALAGNFVSTLGLTACATGVGCPLAIAAKVLAIASVADSCL